jgi:prevent-host-death family protein
LGRTDVNGRKLRALVIRVSVKEAEGHLGQLMEKAAAGQDVLISRAGGPTVRLVSVPQEAPRTGKVGHALDRFMGTWTAEQEAEVLEAVKVFEQART